MTSINVRLSRENYTFARVPAEDETDSWTYQDETFEVADLQNALIAISASDFTEKTPTGQEEVSLTAHLDNEDFPTFAMTLCRIYVFLKNGHL